jgi:hypothetical protein
MQRKEPGDAGLFSFFCLCLKFLEVALVVAVKAGRDIEERGGLGTAPFVAHLLSSVDNNCCAHRQIVDVFGGRH